MKHTFMTKQVIVWYEKSPTNVFLKYAKQSDFEALRHRDAEIEEVAQRMQDRFAAEDRIAKARQDAQVRAIYDSIPDRMIDAARTSQGLPTVAEEQARARADAEVAGTLNSRAGLGSGSNSNTSSAGGLDGSQGSDDTSAYPPDDSDQSTSSTPATKSTSSGSASASATFDVGLVVKERDRDAEARATADRERESAAKAAAYAAVRAKEEADRAANEAKDASWRAAQDAKMNATQSERCKKMATNPEAAARCI